MKLKLTGKVGEHNIYNEQHFTIKKGLTLITGESGIGKTTLLNELETILNIKCKVGKATQDNILIKDLDVRENILFLNEITINEYDVFLYQKLIKDLNLEGLTNKYPDELSGGQQQRVMIARALISNHDILLLDEPTSYQDSENEINILKLLQETAINTPVLCISHDEEVINYADQICTIEEGVIKYLKTTQKDWNLEHIKVTYNIKKLLKKTKKRYRIKKILTTLVLSLILILTSIAIMPSLRGFLTQQKQLNNDEAMFVSLSYSTLQESNPEEQPGGFTFIPGEKPAFYFSEEAIIGLVNQGYVTQIQASSTILKAPTLLTENNTCQTMLTEEQFNSLHDDTHDYETYNYHGCKFYDTYGETNIEVLSGTNALNSETNEIIVPEWYAIQNGYTIDSIIGQDIEIALEHNQEPETFTFNVVGVTPQTNFYIYDIETYYQANSNINIYDDIETNIDNLLKYSYQGEYPEYEMLADWSGEEVYQTYGTGVDNISFYVETPQYDEYYEYINENFPGAVTQDYFYKTQYHLQTLFKQTIKILIIDIILILVWILISTKMNKSINKLNQTDLTIINSYHALPNLERQIDKKRYRKNISSTLIILVIITLPLLLIGNISNIKWLLEDIANQAAITDFAYSITANIIAVGFAWFLIVVVLIIDYLISLRRKNAVYNQK